jgi:Flagellar-associated PapD-like
VAQAKAGAQNQVAAQCVCDPPVLVFKDIDAGAQYQACIKVTNACSQLTAFRVLEVPAEHASILDVKQDRFGFIPAGMAVKLTVYLTPDTESDLSTEIQVLTDKGICRIPVQVLCKKAVLSVSPAVVDLGCIPRGQCNTHQICITNNGALQVLFPSCLSCVSAC